MTRSHGMYGEAEAVIAEAHALERETAVETAELCGRRDEWRRDDRVQVEELWKAVTLVRDVATRMQNPLRNSPYAALGEKIGAEATAMLAEIRNFTPDFRGADADD